MKVNVDKTVLEDAIGAVIRAVPGKSTIPALEGVLMDARGDALTVTAYDTSIGIRTRCGAEIEREGRAVINAKLFSEIVHKLPEDTVTLDCGDGLTADIKCGDSRFSVSTLSPDEYPELPQVEGTEGFEIGADTLGSMLKGTTFAVSANETRPVFTGALFDISDGKLNVVATDGYRLAIRTEDAGGKMEFIVPGRTLNEVERICGRGNGDVKVRLGARHILFLAGDTEIVSRMIDGEFLDWRNVLPKNSGVKVKVDAKSMMRSIDRVSVVVNEKMKSPIRCVFSDSEIVVSTETATGKAKDICDADGDGKGLEIGFNGRYLSDAFRYAQEPEVCMSLNSSVDPAVITGVSGDGRSTLMVLPVRLRGQGQG